MPSASSDNPIIGLVVPAILIVFAFLWMRRSAKTKPQFNPCRICGDNIRFRLGFQGGMAGHFKTVHPEYWRFLRKWTVINTVVVIGFVVSIFPLLIYNIIPARGPPTIVTPIGVAIWIVASISAMGAGILHERQGRRRFRQLWSETHPLQQRTYGNLRGVEVDLNAVRGRARIAIASGLEFLISPISPVITNAAGILFEKAVGKRARLEQLRER